MRKTASCLLLISLIVLCLLSGASASAQGEEWTYITLGSREGASGPEPILWRALTFGEGQALLMSEQVLFPAAVSGDSGFSEWWYASLFDYLNGPFLDNFTQDEQAAMVCQEDQSFISLPDRETLERYLPEPASRAGTGTKEALAAGLYQGKGETFSPYWTRTKGDSFPDAMVRVEADGGFSELSAAVSNVGVRPMILLDTWGMTIASGEGTAEDPYTLHLPAANTRAARVTPEPRPSWSPTAIPTATAAPTPEAPSPTPVPVWDEGPRVFPTEYASLFPALTEEGFLPEGEEAFIYQDREQGLWLYADQNLRLEIVRRADNTRKKTPKRWLTADIYVRKGAPDILRHWFSDGDRTENTLLDELEIANQNRLVFALNGDWYYYRVQRNAKKKVMTVGVVLREGEIVWDDPAKKEASTLPTRDILALFPDGRMEPFAYDEKTGAELKEMGVYETLCFGPILVENGEITSRTKKLSARQAENPRSGIGVVGPGHYVAAVVEGGNKKVSVGMKLEDFAKLFLEKGCVTAFNLNGGGAANMMFMGEYLSENKAASQNREQNEVLGIGVMDQAR